MHPLRFDGAGRTQCGAPSCRVGLGAGRHRHVAVLCGPGNNGGDGLDHRHDISNKLGHSSGGRPSASAAWAVARWITAPRLALATGGGGQHARSATGPNPRRTPTWWWTPCSASVCGVQPRKANWPLAIQAIGQVTPAPRLALDLHPAAWTPTRAQDWGAVPSASTLPDLSRAFQAWPVHRRWAGNCVAASGWPTWPHDGLAEPPALRGDPVAWLRGAEALQAWPQSSARGRWPHQGHKGLQGDVVVLAGELPGAAQLTAHAALAAGTGRVYVQGGAGQATSELMTAPDPMPWERATFVAGCGWREGQDDQLALCLERAPRLVLDAGALNAVALSAMLQQQLAGRAERGQGTILTPHPLEAARLLGRDTATLQDNRLESAQALAELLRCTVVLKGSGSIITSPGSTPAINSTGHAALASPGTGDVLAGWLGGLWAQAQELAPQQLAILAAAWHGAAADPEPLGGAPLLASQLIERMHALHPAPTPR